MSISPLNELVRRIALTGTIREETASQFLEQLTALEYIDSSRMVTIYIDTYGGNIDAMMLIYDSIKTCKCPIRTVGIGKVMSAGTLILAAGDPGNRFVTPNTRVMIHQISGGTIGPLTDMENDLKEAQRLQDQYVSLLAVHTGKSKKQIIGDIKIDKFMSANEAVKYGLADKVLSLNKKSKSKTNSKQK